MPAARSRRAPKTLGESGRGRHSHSTAPSGATRQSARSSTRIRSRLWAGHALAGAWPLAVRTAMSGIWPPSGRDRARSRHPVQQMVADADRVGHGGERGVHSSDAREEARIDDVQVVDLVRFAVDIEDGARRDRCLTGRYPPGEPRLPRARPCGRRVLAQHVVGGDPDVVEHLPELSVQPVRLGVVRRAGRPGAPARRGRRSPGCLVSARLRSSARSPRRAGRPLPGSTSGPAWSAWPPRPSSPSRWTSRASECRPAATPGCSPRGRSRSGRASSGTPWLSGSFSSATMALLLWYM